VDEHVFGTARAPERTGRVDRKAPETLRELVSEFPWVIGLPMHDRGWPRAGQPWVTRMAVPFSDVVATVDGTLTALMIDRVAGDGGGPPDATFDEAKVQAKFTDPAGRRYEVRWRKVVHPPIPGWQTGGGVVLDERLYGSTGTGTPLLPSSEVPGATWALVDVVAAGHVVARNQLGELALTQATRDASGRLGTLDTLPLAPGDTLGGHAIQAHLIVWPIQLIADQPTYAPLALPWLGQDGQPQPYLHVVWGEVDVKPGKLPDPPVRRKRTPKGAAATTPEPTPAAPPPATAPALPWPASTGR
jgi:hypothetical protein